MIGVALIHARSAAWSTAVATVGASPGSGCGISGPCGAAMFHANAKITPTSTGPTVEASLALSPLPGSRRGLDSRRTTSFLRTETQRTSVLKHAGWRHQKVIPQGLQGT